MKATSSIIAMLITTAVSPVAGSADPQEELLAEVRQLKDSLLRMEERLAAVEQQVVRLSGEAVVAATSGHEAAAAGDNASFIDRVVEAVQIREEQVNYPWMNSGLWAGLRQGMSPAEVTALLGEPTLEDPSLHRRIDTVFTYRARRPVSGELVTGKVKFYKGKVVEIEAP